MIYSWFRHIHALLHSTAWADGSSSWGRRANIMADPHLLQGFAQAKEHAALSCSPVCRRALRVCHLHTLTEPPFLRQFQRQLFAPVDPEDFSTQQALPQCTL